ncbi:HET-domain-containing protein [Daldinia decipiens]|uniref:HET-domain-containing protein n=1 Tax=Daldinia decipiens TaxID=326647 RepID=UPI0020C2B6EA|nr:HET-domain-containing protein [Daldinia decipiens]KAI1655701.1 HET-domain-containing protein [Daldinia decipiens]
MTRCSMHQAGVGTCSLVEIAYNGAWGVENKPKCPHCGVILWVVLCHDLDVMGQYSEVSWEDISIETIGFSEIELQRVRVLFNSAPLTTGKERLKPFSFDVFRRPCGIPTHAQNTTKHPGIDYPGQEIMWANRSRTWDVLEDSSTQEAFDRAAGWLSHCMEFDEPCNPPDKNFAPRRLLNVRHRDQIGEPFLFEPKEPTAYACLSYCWGTDIGDVLRTTTSNINDHYKEVPLGSMPKSLRDAVMVCRGLNILYLWVDSICIIQDDRDAWYQDASIMDQIYLNSQVTISALEPSSCKTGFLGKQKFGLPGWQYEITSLVTSEEFIVRPGVSRSEECSLDKRGWCLQEAVLSHRRLCFNGNEMSWECSCRKICECGHCVWPRYGQMVQKYESNVAQLGALLREITSPSASVQKIEVYNLGVSELHGTWLKGNRLTDDIDGAPERIYDLWRRVASNYSRRAVSRQSDKLVALAGLVNIMRKSSRSEASTKNEYIVGLWKKELHFDLTWRVAAFKPRSKLSADEESDVVDQGHFLPSWSWASCEGTISYDDYISPLLLCRGLGSGIRVADKCFIKGIEGIAEDGTPTTKGGRISLEGALIPVELAIFGECIHPGGAFTPTREADVWPFPLGYPRNDIPAISAFIRPRTLCSARVYLDEPADSTMSRDDAQASCWTEGRCKEHCCSWSEDQDSTKIRYYCFRLYSWIMNNDARDSLLNSNHEPGTFMTETLFLVLKASKRVDGAFERVGVGSWAGIRKSEWDVENTNLFRTAKTRIIDII